MADLNNLLDELHNEGDVSIVGSDKDEQHPPAAYDGESGDNAITEERSESASVPAALAAAAARRRRLKLNGNNGAGNEKRDYQAGVKNYEIDDAGDDEQGDGRNFNPDYDQLKALWSAELACPELLPYDAENTALIVEELERQEDAIEDLLQRSTQQGQTRDATGELASLVAQINKMDLDRTRFMLVDLARTRIAKIENHALYNRSLLDRMTAEETSYLRQYGELLEKHYRRTVLNHLPKEAWKKLDEPEMIDSPDLEQFVFCRVLETVRIDVTGEQNILNNDLAFDEDEDGFADNIQEHQAGSCLIVMYKKVMDLVLEGKVELLM